MVCWAGGGIIRSWVVMRYQLGLVRQAGSVIVPAGASTFQGTCESAMNAAWLSGRSAANDAWVRREGADVDQGRDVRVGTRFGDDGAAVGVADQHGRAVLGVEDPPGGGGVAVQ